jgi:hypothetical protein
MPNPWNHRLDQFGRRHTKLMLGWTLFLALATTIILLIFSQDQKILYKAF